MCPLKYPDFSGDRVMKYLFLAGMLFLTGCATVGSGLYQPKSSKEKAAFSRAVFDVSPTEVRTNINAFVGAEFARR